jgi:predicted Zn-ribbon and HTH transcriptional regulator
LARNPKEPSVPAHRRETIRQEIMSVLDGRTFSAKDISAEVGVSEKDVYAHLVHIRKTLEKKSVSLMVTPAECKICGFVFRKRERLTRPGRCPVCRKQAIKEPLFTVR